MDATTRGFTAQRTDEPEVVPDLPTDRVDAGAEEGEDGADFRDGSGSEAATQALYWMDPD